MNLHQIAISLGLTVTELVTQTPIVAAQAPVSNSGDHPQQTCVVYNGIDLFQSRYLYSPLPASIPPPPESERAHVTFAALTLNPSPSGRGTSDSAPLLPGEKGLGDEDNLQR